MVNGERIKVNVSGLLKIQHKTCIRHCVTCLTTRKLIRHGVYSNTQIRDAIKNGHIVCRRLQSKHVAHASLDVTLGYYYYRTERDGDHTIYNPFDEGDVRGISAGRTKRCCTRIGAPKTA